MECLPPTFSVNVQFLPPPESPQSIIDRILSKHLGPPYGPHVIEEIFDAFKENGITYTITITTENPDPIKENFDFIFEQPLKKIEED